MQVGGCRLHLVQCLFISHISHLEVQAVLGQPLASVQHRGAAVALARVDAEPAERVPMPSMLRQAKAEAL